MRRMHRGPRARGTGAVALRPPPAEPVRASARPHATVAEPKKRLSYAERIELDAIMDRITDAEARVAEIEKALSKPTLYASNTERANVLARDLVTLELDDDL